MTNLPNPLKNLNIYAGATARKQLLETGLVANDFDVMLGASGGPKWFVLFGLDKMLVPEFFKHRPLNKPLHLVGSSAGAFRFACLAQQQPEQAIARLAQHYSHMAYSDSPTKFEISQKAEILLRALLGSNGVSEVLDNARFKLHVITARCKHLTKSESAFTLTTGLASSAIGNLLQRKQLKRFYERVVFSTSHQLSFADPHAIPTQQVAMSQHNLFDALLASGAIPHVLEGVENIDGAPQGMYRDGGIIDYHFDFSFPNQQGLTLYPHFFAAPLPGWFDKMAKRKPHQSSYDKVVMLVPSEEFVAQLPFGKISDRKDFEQLPTEERIAYWQTILDKSQWLADDFERLQQPDVLRNHLKPLPFDTL